MATALHRELLLHSRETPNQNKLQSLFPWQKKSTFVFAPMSLPISIWLLPDTIIFHVVPTHCFTPTCTYTLSNMCYCLQRFPAAAILIVFCHILILMSVQLCVVFHWVILVDPPTPPTSSLNPPTRPPCLCLMWWLLGWGLVVARTGLQTEQQHIKQQEENETREQGK